MPIDPFTHNVDTPSDPARDCFTIIPDDQAELPRLTKAIFIGTSGDVVLRAAEAQDDVVFRNLPAGAILDVRVRAIRATGTTAADLVGLA